MDVKIADDLYLSAVLFEKLEKFCGGDGKLAKTIAAETCRVARRLNDDYELCQNMFIWQALIVEDLRWHDLKEGVANVT